MTMIRCMHAECRGTTHSNEGLWLRGHHQMRCRSESADESVPSRSELSISKYVEPLPLPFVIRRHHLHLPSDGRPSRCRSTHNKYDDMYGTRISDKSACLSLYHLQHHWQYVQWLSSKRCNHNHANANARAPGLKLMVVSRESRRFRHEKMG